MNHRSTHTLRLLAATAIFALLLPIKVQANAAAEESSRRPNVIVILTDDQGYGDLSCQGNPKLNTPNLDRLAAEGVEVDQFYVCPVCSPTRSSLMTGRWNYRTGVIDTYLGRSLMRPEEVTIAEMLGGAGYRTGIFGKWHLGDNYPLRPQDQGFQECLMHRGGGISQPSDPPGSGYFDPVLEHNGKLVKTEGYCSDIFTDAAIQFINRSGDEPFFVYLSFNAPHTPLEIADEYADRYRAMNLQHSEFPHAGQPLTGRADVEAIARVYGMVANIDDNVGRLLEALDDAGKTQDTIVIFMTDNGPQQNRYNAGLHGRKGSVYEGGIRVPCFVRWPSRLDPGKVDGPAAHIDIAPTLLDACEVEPPSEVAFDGISILPQLAREKTESPERSFFFQWHRGDAPELGRAMAARIGNYKLVQASGAGHQARDENTKPQLFDIAADPYEMHDLADEKPEVVARLQEAYERWFHDVGSEHNYAPVRMHVGTAHENPVTLTRQDWRGPRAGWDGANSGHWEILVANDGTYDVRLRFPEVEKDTLVRLSVGGQEKEQDVSAGADECVFEAVRLQTGPTQLAGEVKRGEKWVGVHYADVTRVE